MFFIWPNFTQLSLVLCKKKIKHKIVIMVCFIEERNSFLDLVYIIYFVISRI